MKRMAPVPVQLELLVDYGKKVSSLLEEGKYDFIDRIRGHNFKSSKHEKFWHKLFLDLMSFGSNVAITGGEAKQKITEAAYRPAEIHDLLAFGIKYPEIQRYFPIVAVGSAVRILGTEYVPCLVGDDDKRGITIAPICTKFVNCRFLVIKPVFDRLGRFT